MLFKGSRYTNVPIREWRGPAGRTIHYLGVRVIPEILARAGHIVGGAERLDHIAFRYFRDPERFWRICDANNAMRPDDLVAEAGRALRVPPSEE